MTAVTTRAQQAPEPAPALPSTQAPDLQVRPDTVRVPWDRVRFSGPEPAEPDEEGVGSDGQESEPGTSSATNHHAEPEPTSWAATLVRAAVEVLKGQRPAAQLIRWVDADLWAALDRRARLGVQVDGRPGRPAPVRVRRVHGCPLNTAVWECSVVIDDGGRVRAVALRLERLRGRWCATALTIG